MRKPIVLGNWKLNGTAAASDALVASILAGMPALDIVDVGVCPPHVFIPQTVHQAAHTTLAVGGQNCSEFTTGAYTGEVSAEMLREVGCRYVLVGHSERRALFGETNEIVARKTHLALKAGLTPVLCVGETLEEREAGQMNAVVEGQIQAVLNEIGIAQFERLVIAYEPIWAIGTGLTASPAQAQAMHAMIRGVLSTQNPAAARAVRIQYGGSVKADNAAELFAEPDIDGGLIGGASLKAEDFLIICRAAADSLR
ncbi:MAG: triose-phosphate isomerase [Halothiobacillus sp. 20-53-49]|nr:triose-phosphate isomerase [Halothiobacillaceae bacterium]OYV47199.1 MAG: triose-phosphate isomerase [Halothiobacillus sp. 20-53-49]HUM99696.1 triose-phosphate isomerase [Halothiobacillus sp.]